MKRIDQWLKSSNGFVLRLNDDDEWTANGLNVSLIESGDVWLECIEGELREYKLAVRFSLIIEVEWKASSSETSRERMFAIF